MISAQIHSNADVFSEGISQSQISARANTRKVATWGLKCLDLLHIKLMPYTIVEPEVLISIVAYTNPLDPWTDATTIASAKALLSHFSAQITSTKCIINDVFAEFIRPLFLKTKKLESITASGRKAMESSAPPARFEAGKEIDHANQPWRYDAVYTITVLGWAVENIDVSHFSYAYILICVFLEATFSPGHRH